MHIYLLIFPGFVLSLWGILCQPYGNISGSVSWSCYFISQNLCLTWFSACLSRHLSACRTPFLQAPAQRLLLGSPTPTQTLTALSVTTMTPHHHQCLFHYPSPPPPAGKCYRCCWVRVIILSSIPN